MTGFFEKLLTILAFFVIIQTGTAYRQCYFCRTSEGPVPTTGWVHSTIKDFSNPKLTNDLPCMADNWAHIERCEGLCKTSVVTGENPDGSKWKWTEHDCYKIFIQNFNFPECITRKLRPMKGDDGGYKNVVKTTCSCGKDFCNFGDAKGDKECIRCTNDGINGISFKALDIEGRSQGKGQYPYGVTCEKWIKDGKPSEGTGFLANCVNGYCYAQTETIVKYSDDKSHLRSRTRTEMGCREEITTFTDNTCQNVSLNYQSNALPTVGREDALFLEVQECRCGSDRCNGEADLKNTTQTVEIAFNEWKQMRRAQGHKEEIIVVSPNENIDDNGETKSSTEEASTEETVYEPQTSGWTRGSSAMYFISLAAVLIMILG